MKLKATVLHAPLLGSTNIPQSKKAATNTISNKINNIAANILCTILLSGAIFLFMKQLTEYGF